MTAIVSGNALALDEAAQDLLFREARTANAFTDEPVSEEQIRAIYELVKWGPTAMNGQPMRLLLVRSSEAKARLLPHMAEGNRAKTASAPLTAIVTADGDFHEHLPTVFPHRPGIRDSMAANPGRPNVARFNAAIQLGYLIVGIRAAGLAAGPMTGFDAEGIEREFLAGTGQQAIAVVNIGRPAPDAFFPRNPRLAFDQVVSTL
ncbi:putative NADH dehydrogenase/NAD(P)H nitroreductase [Actinomadura sp. NBRC 104425]|uniref:malonic semialdehyde reductase n=1 Tax=Actinomadura sp. NBRC 104425 TaxID=3032204 RepID=UPI0024A3851B|nr:malonic semialdehyde reductase [Actinomadura sp. NBRC 104425]GLZ16163.1 putative NADH dehydrogenase/NAD(P)H nitroreductase [Actinomadura sp. NBRC 104425]